MQRDFLLLPNLAAKMQNCGIALNHMQYQSDLNNLHTLEPTVCYLPVDIQRRLAEEVNKIGKEDREAKFWELGDYF